MSENYEQPSELKSVPNEAVATDAVPTICKACGADWKQHSPIMYWCPNGKTRWEPNTPASDQPEYRPLGPDEVIRTSEKVEFRYKGYYTSAWEIPPVENKFEGQLVRDWPSYEFRRPIAAEKREDTRTCGEISCDECNERYQKAIAEISTLRQQLAQVRKLNDIMHKFSVFCHSKTCIHHTDAERQGSGCPVCLQKQLAQEKEARVKAETLIRHLPCHCGNFGPNLKCPCCQAKDAIQRWANEDARAALQQSEGG